MTNDDLPHAEFIEAQRAWLKEHIAQTGLSWSEIASRTQAAEGTISQFGGKKGYSGHELPLAEKVQRYRELLLARDTTYVDAPEIPDYFETQTSAEIIALLHWCQRGKMVSAPLGSGLGKTKSATRFQSLYPNVFIVTIWPSCGCPGPMQIAVLEALGVKNATGSPYALSQMICAKLATMHRPVLIFDEAQELTVKSLEEIRGWQGRTGAGIALFGDQRLANLINNGAGKSDLPQLRRRIKSMAARVVPFAQDVAALAGAWGIDEPRLVKELEQIARKPGGLGLATMVLEEAAMFASAEQAPLGLSHLKEAAADVLRQGVAA